MAEAASAFLALGINLHCRCEDTAVQYSTVRTYHVLQGSGL